MKKDINFEINVDNITYKRNQEEENISFEFFFFKQKKS